MARNCPPLAIAGLRNLLRVLRGPTEALTRSVSDLAPESSDFNSQSLSVRLQSSSNMRDHPSEAEASPSNPLPRGISPEAVRAELASVLSSGIFSSATRSSRFLHYVVEATLAGNRDSIKESVLGSEVFDRVRDFDPRIDAIVRVEATKLRSRLAEYYEGEGAEATVVIDIPKGTYVPRFTLRPIATGDDKKLVANKPTELSPPMPVAAGKSRLKIGMAIVTALALLGATAWYLRSRNRPTALPPTNLQSIAVLPFINLSSDPENEYFSDGLTEQLTDVLARSGVLRVAARTSAFAFKGKGQDVGEIGAKLHVDAVLESSVRKDGQRLRITTQLIRVSDGMHIWSQTYDRPSNDIFAVQDDISQSILAAVTSQMADRKPPKPVRRYTDNLEAFDLYLKGKSEANLWHLESARKLFEQATTLDPNFALAYVEIAGIYLKEGLSAGLPPAEVLRLARAAATRALEIDSGLSQAHAVLATIEGRYEWDWAAAEQHFRSAIELNPNDAVAHSSYAMDLLLPLRRTNEALEHCRVAQQLDPISTMSGFCVPWVLMLSGEAKSAVADYDIMLASQPEVPMIRFARAMAYLRLREFQKAIEDLEAQPPDSTPKAFLAYAYARSGQTEKAAHIEEQMMKQSHEKYVSPMVLAVVHSGLGMKSQALDDLERGVDEHSPNAIYLGLDPAFEPLHDEPRFQALLRRIHLQ